MSLSKHKNDKELKEEGNKYFSARDFHSAIISYTDAIKKNSNIPQYYTNRALCYLNLQQWDNAIIDSKLALEKDPNLVKGHFYLGNLVAFYHTSARHF